MKRSLHLPLAKHGLDLSHLDIAPALAQPAAGFRRQPTSNHHGTRPFRGCVDNSPGVIERAEEEHAVFVQAVRKRNDGLDPVAKIS